MRYADASALVKLVVPEAETSAFVAMLEKAGRRLATSSVGAVEFVRVARRLEGDAGAAQARIVLSRCDVLDVSPAVESSASDLLPVGLRAMDAIHLATAISIREITNDFYCYDRRLCAAAAAAGLNVLSPGLTPA